MDPVCFRAITCATLLAVGTSCSAAPTVPETSAPTVASSETRNGRYHTQQYGSMFSRAQWVYADNSWRYVYPGQFNFSGWVYTLLPWWGWVWVWFPYTYTGWMYVWGFGWAYIGGWYGPSWWGGWPGWWGGGPGGPGGWRGGSPVLAQPGATVNVPSAFAARAGGEASSATETVRAPSNTPGAPPFGGARPSGGPSESLGPTAGPSGAPGGGPMGGPPGAPPGGPPG